MYGQRGILLTPICGGEIVVPGLPPGILHANGINKADYNDLVKQDTAQIFEDKPNLRKFANSTVKLGKIGNMLMSGGAVGGKKVNPWLAHVKQYREDNPGISYVQALKQAKSTYKK